MRLFGVLVTFDRPQALVTTMGRLAAQTRKPDQLFVVDNGADAPADEVVSRYSASLDPVYLQPGENIGPAGGFALGMTKALEVADDDDWIVLLDDDDPPYFDNALEDAARFAVDQLARDQTTGAVGISGGRFDFGRGRVIRIGDSEIGGSVRVDHITGGGLPLYRAGALRSVGVMREDLFFGYEELELGLRLEAGGHSLYADGEAWRLRKADKRGKGLLPPEEVSARRASSTSLRVGVTSWRRYYSLRNLILILRDNGHSWAAARISLTRGLLKPILNLFTTPRTAAAQLALGARAVKDGWMRNTGRTLDPPSGASNG
jgi:rhamnopyranosyl-N-acetylglucosaminyl-diphospho-decaprenol beta-1,3/1,4-galactofuranosyltransferase